MKLKNAALLALGTALISGVANFVAKIAVTVVPNPVVFTFLKNAIVAMLLVGIIALATRFKELKTLQKPDWYKLIGIGVIGGSIPFILFFTGLTMTSGLSASLIHKTLFIWVALLAVPFLRERIGPLQGAAFLLLIGGNFALGGLNNFNWGTGELMIMGATLFWAVENIIAKKVLKNVSSLLVAGSRMVFGSVILFVVVLFQGNVSLLGGLNSEQWLWTLVPAVLLFGYVTTWYTAMKYAPVTLVASLLVPATLITNLLGNIFLDKTMTAGQVTSGIFVTLAVVLLMWEVMRYRKDNAVQRYSEN